MYKRQATVRKATLHAVGDLQGNIGTGALNAFADKLTGYSLLNGAFGAQRGNDLYLTIDARYNYTAYEALGGKSGTVAVYNYETGEILCMVSAPSYDPLNVPEDITTNDRYKGAYLNRFLSSTFTPGSVYQTVTLAAALELSLIHILLAFTQAHSDHGGADRVLEVAGAEETFRLAWQCARPNAVVTVVALYDRPQLLPLPEMYGKNLTFKTGGVDGCDSQEILDLIAAGKLDTTPLITHTVPLRDIAAAYDLFEHRRDGVIKVAVDCSMA